VLRALAAASQFVAASAGYPAPCLLHHCRLLLLLLLLHGDVAAAGLLAHWCQVLSGWRLLGFAACQARQSPSHPRHHQRLLHLHFDSHLHWQRQRQQQVAELLAEAMVLAAAAAEAAVFYTAVGAPLLLPAAVRLAAALVAARLQHLSLLRLLLLLLLLLLLVPLQSAGAVPEHRAQAL
jgi:hypothetical protein